MLIECVFLINLACIASASIQARFQRKVQWKNWGKVKIMLEKYDSNQLDPSYIDNFALKTATTQNRDDVIRLLLEDNRVEFLQSPGRPDTAFAFALRGKNPKVLLAYLEDWRVPGHECLLNERPSFEHIPEDLLGATYIYSDIEIQDNFNCSNWKAVDFQLFIRRCRQTPLKKKVFVRHFLARIGIKPQHSGHIVDAITSSDLSMVKEIFAFSMRVHYLCRIFKDLPVEIVTHIAVLGLENYKDGLEFPKPLTPIRYLQKHSFHMALVALFATFLIALINIDYALKYLGLILVLCILRPFYGWDAVL